MKVGPQKDRTGKEPIMPLVAHLPDNPYLLLTPGPLSTSKGVKAAMLRDWCTWDEDYNGDVVEDIRRQLTHLAASAAGEFTTVLMQGSGTFTVEATLGTMLPRGSGKLLVCSNGAYGDRMVKIAEYLSLPTSVLRLSETVPVTAERIKELLQAEPEITHVALVHNETSTGMLNPLPEIAATVKCAGKVLMVDAMSSFGGIPMDMNDLGVDWLVSSANKCIQGVPGFGFVIVRRSLLENSGGNARSLSLDLFDQWQTMEAGNGKWRYTSPTHVVRAFQQALRELAEEGGIAARHARYCENQRRLVAGMERLGFACLLPKELHSPIITSFYSPASANYSFAEFYARLKKGGFVIYPGNVSEADCFRIGNIGEVYSDDIDRLLQKIREEMFWVSRPLTRLSTY